MRGGTHPGTTPGILCCVAQAASDVTFGRGWWNDESKSEIGGRHQGKRRRKAAKVVYYRDKKAIREWLTLSAIEIIQGGPSDHSC